MLFRSAATLAPAQEAIDLMDLTSRTAELFMAQQVHEQQRFLRLVLKSASWQHGELRTEFEEPFETLRRSNQLSRTKHKENRMRTTEIENWLPGNAVFKLFLSRFLNVCGNPKMDSNWEPVSILAITSALSPWNRTNRNRGSLFRLIAIAGTTAAWQACRPDRPLPRKVDDGHRARESSFGPQMRLNREKRH